MLYRVLFVVGAIGFVGALTARCTQAPSQQTPAFRNIGTLAEVMEANVSTSSQVIFDAVVYNNGVLDHAPKTTEEWETVEHAAIALGESANLLLLPGRPMNNGEWVAMTHALADGAVRARDAALAKNVDQLLDAGTVIYDACTACHAKYLAQAKAQREQQHTAH